MVIKTKSRQHFSGSCRRKVRPAQGHRWPQRFAIAENDSICICQFCQRWLPYFARPAWSDFFHRCWGRMGLSNPQWIGFYQSFLGSGKISDRQLCRSKFLRPIFGFGSKNSLRCSGKLMFLFISKHFMISRFHFPGPILEKCSSNGADLCCHA